MPGCYDSSMVHPGTNKHPPLLSRMPSIITPVTPIESIPKTDTIYVGDCLEVMRSWPDKFVQTVVTSPPYWGLRDYGVAGQMGLEATPQEYTESMVNVFREVRRVLKDDGTLWLNLGDSYATGAGGRGDIGNVFNGKPTRTDAPSAGRISRKRPAALKPKDLVGVPWRMAFALQADGWYLRSDIIWSKPNPMPESVTDRPTRAHEYLFLMTKSERYFYDADAIKEPATYGAPNSPESIKSPYGQGYARRAQAVPSGWDIGPGDHRGLAGCYKNTDYSDGAGRNDGGRHVSGGFPKKLPEGQTNIRKARDKQRGHSRRHAGFNDRWDAMVKAEQCYGMRNKRSVWTVATCPFAEAHFATFPPDLIRPCILSGSRPNDIVLDPFMGAGTTALISAQYDRRFLGIELNQEYAAIAERRIEAEKSQIKMSI